MFENDTEQVIKNLEEQREKRLKELHDEFIEPVVALQDFDIGFPQKSERAFYSIYNFLEALIKKEDELFAISINQAHEALIYWNRDEFWNNAGDNYLSFWYKKCLSLGYLEILK